MNAATTNTRGGDIVPCWCSQVLSLGQNAESLSLGKRGSVCTPRVEQPTPSCALVYIPSARESTHALPDAVQYRSDELDKPSPQCSRASRHHARALYTHLPRCALCVMSSKVGSNRHSATPHQVRLVTIAAPSCSQWIASHAASNVGVTQRSDVDDRAFHDALPTGSAILTRSSCSLPRAANETHPNILMVNHTPPVNKAATISALGCSVTLDRQSASINRTSTKPHSLATHLDFKRGLRGPFQSPLNWPPRLPPPTRAKRL